MFVYIYIYIYTHVYKHICIIVIMIALTIYLYVYTHITCVMCICFKLYFLQACLAELGDENRLPPADALTSVTHILASLLHRRPAVAAALGQAGMTELLAKLHKWSLMSIDFMVVPFARGYRTVCMGAAAPAPPGVGEPLLAPAPWLTPVVVCAHQVG